MPVLYAVRRRDIPVCILSLEGVQLAVALGMLMLAAEDRYGTHHSGIWNVTVNAETLARICGISVTQATWDEVVLHREPEPGQSISDKLFLRVEGKWPQARIALREPSFFQLTERGMSSWLGREFRPDATYSCLHSARHRGFEHVQAEYYRIHPDHHPSRDKTYPSTLNGRRVPPRVESLVVDTLGQAIAPLAPARPVVVAPVGLNGNGAKPNGAAPKSVTPIADSGPSKNGGPVASPVTVHVPTPVVALAPSVARTPAPLSPLAAAKPAVVRVQVAVPVSPISATQLQTSSCNALPMSQAALLCLVALKQRDSEGGVTKDSLATTGDWCVSPDTAQEGCNELWQLDVIRTRKRRMYIAKLPESVVCTTLSEEPLCIFGLTVETGKPITIDWLLQATKGGGEEKVPATCPEVPAPESEAVGQPRSLAQVVEEPEADAIPAIEGVEGTCLPANGLAALLLLMRWQPDGKPRQILFASAGKPYGARLDALMSGVLDLKEAGICKDAGSAKYQLLEAPEAVRVKPGRKENVTVLSLPLKTGKTYMVRRLLERLSLSD